MQEQRPAELAAELELRDEAFLLVGTGGVVAVEIQPAFADRHDAGVLRQRAQRGESSSGLSFASSSRSASGEGSGSSGLLQTNRSPCCDDARLESSRTWR